MSATYESGEVITKQSSFDNVPDIMGTFGISAFLWFANIYLLHCGLDQASKSKKKKKSTETLISEKETLIAEIDFKLNDKKGNTSFAMLSKFKSKTNNNKKDGATNWV